MIDSPSSTLAERLGITTPVAPLQFKIKRLIEQYPSPGAERTEDWLLDVANVRGADFVLRVPPRDPSFTGPSEREFNNEELATAICRPGNLDRPQMIRAAAQLISREMVDADALWLTAQREKADRVLAEIARQAVRTAPHHPIWSRLVKLGENTRRLRSPILHWSRLAVPVPDDRGVNARSWRLIA